MWGAARILKLGNRPSYFCCCLVQLFLIDFVASGDVAGSPLLGQGQLDKMRQEARGHRDVGGYEAYQGLKVREGFASIVIFLLLL
jgi:hypothetical protein